MRLAKFLAHAGVASRRSAEAIIREGRVEIDGNQVFDPAQDVTGAETVTVNGAPVALAAELVVYAVNKPAGVVSTANDPQHRPTIVSMLPTGIRLYPVGRLDIDSTGLILLTNDGELAYRLTHPRFEVPKTYLARVARAPVRERALRTLRDGVMLEDGLTAPARVRRLAANQLEMTIHEGRKRQVRRMCEAVGHPVRSLERIRVGPLELGELRVGSHRRLTPAEVEALRALTREPRTVKPAS